MDAVSGGVSDFDTAYKDGGMLAAQTASYECYERARAAKRILGVDRCAGLNLAAQTTDESFSQMMGSPLNPYFSATNARMRTEYA